MLVPLQRPLSQVKPEVRDVAAYAQGRGGAASAPQKIVNVAEGAIQVNTPNSNARQVANAVLDRLAGDLD